MQITETTPAEKCRVFKLLMDTFDEERQLWIEQNGSDEGFNLWFSAQFKNMEKQNEKRTDHSSLYTREN